MNVEMEEMPLVSVVVPVYNSKEYLERCLDSILVQTYKNLEIILVDDGSTDGSGEFCDELACKDSRIKVIHQENKGLSGARNTGISIARGEYIGFVDSDDWIDGNFYESLMEVMIATKCQMVSCNYVEVEENKQYRNNSKKSSVMKMDKEKSIRWYMNGIISGGKSDCPVWTKLYHASIFSNIRFPEGMLFEDVITNWHIINKIDGYAYCNRVGYFYFKREDSISREPYRKKVKDLVLGARIMRESIEDPTPQVDFLLKQYEERAYFSILVKMIRGKGVDKDDFVETLRRVKENYKYLILSSLTITRKIVLTGVRIIPDKMIVLLMEMRKKLR